MKLNPMCRAFFETLPCEKRPDEMWTQRDKDGRGSSPSMVSTHILLSGIVTGSAAPQDLQKQQ